MKRYLYVFVLLTLMSACTRGIFSSPVPAGATPTGTPTATIPAATSTTAPTLANTAMPTATTAPTLTPAATLAATSTTIATPKPSGWTHGPVLGAPQGYPGWIRMAGSQESDGLPRYVEIEVSSTQIVLIFGDEATIPGLPGQHVGGQWTNNKPFSGCYLVVVKGPFVWDTQPTGGEFSPIHWPARSAWDLHDVDATANPFVWAAQKYADLAKDYPLTCGVNIDVWVYNP